MWFHLQCLLRHGYKAEGRIPVLKAPGIASKFWVELTPSTGCRWSAWRTCFNPRRYRRTGYSWLGMPRWRVTCVTDGRHHDRPVSSDARYAVMRPIQPIPIREVACDISIGQGITTHRCIACLRTGGISLLRFQPAPIEDLKRVSPPPPGRQE